MAVQFLVFVLLEALFIYGKYQANYLVYNSTVYDWASDVFGMVHGDNVVTLLSVFIAAEVCAWHIGLQRFITFGGHTPRRWTILPVALGYLALSLISWLLPSLLVNVTLPLPTENMMVYTVLHSLLYVAIVSVSCALLHAFRRKEQGRAGLLAVAEMVLVLLLVLCSACSGQIQRHILEETYADPAAPQVVVTTIGASEGEGTDELLASILSHSGLDAEDVVIVPAEEALSGFASATDPFAAYEEAMKPSTLLGDILMWVQLIPIFFAMKRWLFPLDSTPIEVAP